MVVTVIVVLWSTEVKVGANVDVFRTATGGVDSSSCSTVFVIANVVVNTVVVVITVEVTTEKSSFRSSSSSGNNSICSR